MRDSTTMPFPQSLEGLRREILQKSLNRLRETYTSLDEERFKFCPALQEDMVSCVGTGSAAQPVVAGVLSAVQEMVVPGVFIASTKRRDSGAGLGGALTTITACLYSLLQSFFQIESEARKCNEDSALAALNLIAHLPVFREHSRWNIFASRKDPALWDSYVLQNEKRREELGRLDLISVIDQAIQNRNPSEYRDFLKEWGFVYAYDYQRMLIEHAYPGWRALLMHDIAHTLALGGVCAGGGILAKPTPLLPRIISEQAASLYQTDLHPETVIGDANFLEHPHRGITTGQTGRIGIGCVIYPCTLGGITDKVKPRHPTIGDYVLIGTDVGIFGPVSVANHSVIGANTEINGMVEVGEMVKIRAAVVARTVISESGKPGKIIFSEGVTVGEECLIVNDHPTDLIIPPGSSIAAGTHVVNDGNGNPKFG
jgi:serine acetyltransferase